MGTNPNTMSFQQIWAKLYQITHYKLPCFRVLADETEANQLKTGDTFHRQYKTDFIVNDLGADGSYSTQAISNTDEYLTVNVRKEVSFQTNDPDAIQDHLPTKVDYGRKAMNNLFLQIDADILSALRAGAGSTLDDGDLGGTSGNGITATIANIDQIFAGALMKLQLQNVIYDPNTIFSGDVKLDRVKSMPMAVISPQLYNVLILRLGGKNTVLGDKVSSNGHAGVFMSFNIFVSNNLAWTGTFALSVAPTANDVIVYNGIHFKWVSSASATATAGTAAAPAEIEFTNATDANVNLAAALNDPFTVTALYSGLTKLIGNLKALANITATVVTATSTSIVQKGIGNVVVSQTMTSASNAWTATTLIQHNIFAVNQCISLIIQKTPNIVENSVSGKVAKDYIIWSLYGYKVFVDQAKMIVDVKVRTDGMTSAPAIVSY